MNTKILSAFLLTALLSVLMLSVISAVDLISISKGPVFSDSNTQTYFDITGLQNSNIVMPSSVVRINDGNNNYMTVTLNPTSLNQAITLGTTQRVIATVTVDPNFVSSIQDYSFPAINVVATTQNGTATLTDTKPIILTLRSNLR